MFKFVIKTHPKVVTNMREVMACLFNSKPSQKAYDKQECILEKTNTTSNQYSDNAHLRQGAQITHYLCDFPVVLELQIRSG